MKKIKFLSCTLLMIPTLLFTSCGSTYGFEPSEVEFIDDNYRNYYEIFVGSYVDSDGDGMGDLKGVTSKLDYIRDLGFSGIWLMPINQSTTYHKYNVDNYYAIDDDYGTMEDFEELLEEAHKRGIKVIMDLVLNHSGIENLWFDKAVVAYNRNKNGETLTSEEENFKDLYSFSDTFQPGFTQVPGYSFYYESNFSSDMPEFNWDSSYFKTLYQEVVDFYLDKGVDGFRLDAVRYFYLNNDSKNIAALKEFNDYVKSKKSDAYIVGENWSGTDSIKSYYNSGVDSFFYFDASSSNSNNGFVKFSVNINPNPNRYLNGLLQMESNCSKGIPAPFLNNHDMRRVWYAKDEILNKFMYGLLSMLTGTTFTYYGDEINMTGNVNPDQNVRIHMNWGDESIETRDPIGTTLAEYNFPSVAEQEEDIDSKLNYVRKTNYLRNTIPEIARGSSKEIVSDSENKYLILEKEYNNNSIYIVFNFSDQENKIDLSSVNYNEVIGEINLNYNDKSSFSGNSIDAKPYSITILR